jgi:hypothetical protein
MLFLESVKPNNSRIGRAGQGGESRLAIVAIVAIAIRAFVVKVALVM